MPLLQTHPWGLAADTLQACPPAADIQSSRQYKRPPEKQPAREELAGQGPEGSVEGGCGRGELF